MDLNRLFTMLSKMFIRSAVKTGVDYAARSGKPAAEMTPEERKQAENAKAMAQKAQKAAKVARRLWR
jgi:flagellar motility protein MotE (MotC chaperone)